MHFLFQVGLLTEASPWNEDFNWASLKPYAFISLLFTMSNAESFLMVL